MSHKNLQLDQLDRRMSLLASAHRGGTFPHGWLRAIRSALGISLEQMAKMTGKTRQGMMALEKREREGAATLKTLREAGAVLGLELVYGFVPIQDGSLSALVDRKAQELAREIVERTLQTMALEGQSPSPKRIEQAVRDRAAEIRRDMPKSLWDA
jgi:predicted DNA-binding mobile mystery protein A